VEVWDGVVEGTAGMLELYGLSVALVLHVIFHTRDTAFPLPQFIATTRQPTPRLCNMTWTLQVPNSDGSASSNTRNLPKEGVAHIVLLRGATTLAVVHEIRPALQTELGRISASHTNCLLVHDLTADHNSYRSIRCKARGHRLSLEDPTWPHYE
jgi:hypothetical protein